MFFFVLLFRKKVALTHACAQTGEERAENNPGERPANAPVDRFVK